LILPPGSLYAWVATESSLSRKVRRVLLDDFKLDEATVKAAGYWRADGSDEE
jgi:NADPH-dependent ferric siderophore reductase